MRKFAKIPAILITTAAALLLLLGAVISSALPDSVSTADGGKILPGTNLPVTISECGDALKPASSAGTADNYSVSVNLFGKIPIKKISVRQTQRKKVILCGTPFGVKIFTDGVMIVGVTEVCANGAMRSPAAQSGLLTGDIIESVNGKKVFKNGEVARIIESSGGKKLDLDVRRGREKFTAALYPVKTDDGIFRAGMWIRDSSAGIGTMTYIDPETGAFGGLGHGICDVDTGSVVPISDGEIVGVALVGMTKSRSGSPGELRGYLDPETVGTVKMNTELGVYGVALRQGYSTTVYETAFKQEIRRGAAKMKTTVPGSAPALYDITIDKINYDEKSKSRNLVIKVTDERLLAASGGIVQGMSGSPIIQDGRFVGAVTHVFVNDPTLGYGIFAENMLENSARCTITTRSDAS